MDDVRNIDEGRAAELGDGSLEWNELDFVGWKEFQRMAPAVLGLELSRIDRMLPALEPATDTYNTLIRARYELRSFADTLQAARKDDIHAASAHLTRALLALSMLAPESDTLQYTTRRLEYIHHRLALIY